ncbi:dual specificity phosphatase, partial [Dipodascopsis tothii]|uniref:dual specificity phosphatase n=1 Tax=Dipodascopsis tothii TaxID=44089 RepID=UPI0034CF73A4
YPDGPVAVYAPQIYIYSEPTAAEAAAFDVVINVARELPAGATHTRAGAGRPEYVSVAWEHNSKITPDLPFLTALMAARAAEGKRVLVHCQCGVSRSACLIVAFVMKERGWDLNRAYMWVKRRAPAIGPNMRLIYQLMEWGKTVGGDGRDGRDDDDSDA